MLMITLQYLEDSPDLATLDPREVIQKLRGAIECISFSHILIGWHLPPRLLDACRKDAKNAGIKFILWHPVLTSDAVFTPCPEWQITGLMGTKVKGLQAKPEFTFVCPNHPDAREAIIRRIEDLSRSGLYEGIFLDRIRFPSPSCAPLTDLGCFCDHCQRKAETMGLDLARIQRVILEQTATENGRIMLIKGLLGCPGDQSTTLCSAIQDFMDFRCRSIANLIEAVVTPIHAAKMEVGLDCFSPSLTSMVGQDLDVLSGLSDWVKIMTYVHTFAPAGIPFELSGLLNFLTANTNLSYTEAMALLNDGLPFQITETRDQLEKEGLSTRALAAEIRGYIRTGNIPILAGVELVDKKGITHITEESLARDLQALMNAPIDGLALSWDLRHIPLEWLELVSKNFLQ